MGTVCETPSPVSITLPVVRPETYRTVWVAMNMAGTLNVPNLVWHHALSVNLGVRGQNGMLFRRTLEFVVEREHNMTCKSLRMSASHFTTIKKEESRIPLGMKLGWINPPGSSSVSSSVAQSKTNVAPFLSNITNSLPLCGGSE